MWPVHRVGHLQVAVRLGAVAGVPALAELVTGGDRLTGSDAHRPRPQVSRQDERAAGAKRDHHMIAG